MKLTLQALTIPDPAGVSLQKSYSMVDIYAAETRMDEIAFVTPTKGPELLSTFNKALKQLGEHLADLAYQESVAKRKARERRAVVVLDVIPGRLAEKKLSNNDTNREAIIDLDPEYSAATDVQNQIEAAFILIREKLKSMESAINSTKKSLDLTANLNTYKQNPSLGMSAEQAFALIGPTTYRDDKTASYTDGLTEEEIKQVAADLYKIVDNNPTPNTPFAIGKAKY